MNHLPPPIWDNERLDIDRLVAIQLFREDRMREPLEKYLQNFEHFQGVVEDLLELTVDLTQIFEKAEEILTNKDLMYAVRYLAGPILSEADLKILADTSIAPARLRDNPEARRVVLETVLLGLDRGRFPWVAEGREPTEAERSAAVVATAALYAVQRVRTDRANQSALDQQQAVMTALVASGFTEVPRRSVNNLGDAPGPGEVCPSGMFGGRDADLIVGLWDKRVMPVECKVSNSSANSVKRLNNDTASKAEAWIRDFGRRQLVPTAVLAGVFERRNLEAAQDAGLTIFWAHKLDAMIDWVEQTKT